METITIQVLPVELLERILGYLPTKSIAETRQVCSQWNELNPLLWRQLSFKRWGENILSLEDSNGILTNASLSKFFTAHQPIKPLKKDGSGEIDWVQYFGMRSSFERLLEPDTMQEFREFTPNNVLRALRALEPAKARTHLIIDCWEYFALLNNEKLFKSVPQLQGDTTRLHVHRLMSLCKLLQSYTQYFGLTIQQTSYAFNQLPGQLLVASDVETLKEIIRMMIQTTYTHYPGFYYGSRNKAEPFVKFQAEAFDEVYEHLQVAKDDVVLSNAIRVFDMFYKRTDQKFEEKSQKSWVRNIKFVFSPPEQAVRDLNQTILSMVENALSQSQVVVDWLSDEEVRLLLEVYLSKKNYRYYLSNSIILRGLGPRAAKLMSEEHITIFQKEMVEELTQISVDSNKPTYLLHCAEEVAEFLGGRLRNFLPEYKKKILGMDKNLVIMNQLTKRALELSISYVKLGYYIMGDEFRPEAKEIIQLFTKETEQENFKTFCHVSGDVIVKTFENDTKFRLRVISAVFEYLPDSFIEYGCSPRQPIKYPALQAAPNWVPTDTVQFLKKIPEGTKNQKTIAKARDLLDSIAVRKNREDISYKNSFIKTERGKGDIKPESRKGWDLSTAVSTLNRIAMLDQDAFAPHLQRLFHANLGIFRESWCGVGVVRHSHELIWVYEAIKPKLKSSDWLHYMNILTTTSFLGYLSFSCHLSQDFIHYEPEYQYITHVLLLVQQHHNASQSVLEEKNLALAWPGQVKFNIEQRNDLRLQRLAAYCGVFFGIPLVLQKIDNKFIESLSKETFAAIAKSDMQRNAFIKACIINAAADLDSSVIGLHLFSSEKMYGKVAAAVKNPKFDTGIEEINQFAKKLDFKSFDFRFFGV